MRRLMGNLLVIANALIALGEIVPIIGRVYDKLTELWVDIKIQKSESERATKLKKRKAILQAIQDAKTDEQRKTLSVILADINLGN